MHWEGSATNRATLATLINLVASQCRLDFIQASHTHTILCVLQENIRESVIVKPEELRHYVIRSKVTAILSDKVAELHWKGSATNGDTPFSFIILVAWQANVDWISYKPDMLGTILCVLMENIRESVQWNSSQLHPCLALIFLIFGNSLPPWFLSAHVGVHGVMRWQSFWGNRVTRRQERNQGVPRGIRVTRRREKNQGVPGDSM